jgi:hypothetical protein
MSVLKSKEYEPEASDVVFTFSLGMCLSFGPQILLIRAAFQVKWPKQITGV